MERKITDIECNYNEMHRNIVAACKRITKWNKHLEYFVTITALVAAALVMGIIDLSCCRHGIEVHALIGLSVGMMVGLLYLKFATNKQHNCCNLHKLSKPALQEVMQYCESAVTDEVIDWLQNLPNVDIIIPMWQILLKIEDGAQVIYQANTNGNGGGKVILRKEVGTTVIMDTLLSLDKVPTAKPKLRITCDTCIVT